MLYTAVPYTDWRQDLSAVHKRPGLASVVIWYSHMPDFQRIMPLSLLTMHPQDPQYRNSLAVRPYTLADLARHLRTAMPPGWDHPMSTQAVQPPTVGAAGHGVGGPVALGLGRPWDGGRDHRSDGPGGRWLWQLWGLVNTLLDAATTWQVRPSLSARTQL